MSCSSNFIFCLHKLLRRSRELKSQSFKSDVRVDLAVLQGFVKAILEGRAIREQRKQCYCRKVKIKNYPLRYLSYILTRAEGLSKRGTKGSKRDKCYWLLSYGG